jgi:hypothetical protein
MLELRAELRRESTLELRGLQLKIPPALRAHFYRENLGELSRSETFDSWRL